MINAAGYKVWPAEVEMTLYKHPGIKEVAIISSPDTRKGETVKAVVVPQDEFREKYRETILLIGQEKIWRRTRYREASNL